MHITRFDALSKALGTGMSRRATVGSTLSATLGAVLAGGSGPGRGHALAASTPAATPDTASTPEATPGSASSVCFETPPPSDLQDRAPGDLIASEELTAADDPNFPKRARIWRVLYVSTGRDNTEKTLSCGIVAVPKDLSTLDRTGDTGRMAAWTHGTLGIVPRCQPTANLALEIWGTPPFGINTISWGSEARGDAHLGKPEDGMLAGMIDRGWVVTATDYAGGIGNDGLQPFVLGKIEAANAVDNLRAAHHLLATLDADLPTTWETVVWGHSQGGHAALWTGQVLEAYDAATRAPDGPSFRLAGVFAEAPASNILTTASVQGEDAIGFSLFDWVAHTELQLTGLPTPIPIAPFLFSYVIAAWSDHASGTTPDPAAMPAFPATGPLDPAAIVTADGEGTIGQMTELCWADGEAVAEVVAPYTEKAFLVEALSDGATIDGFQHGNFDRTLAQPPTPELASWAEWLHFTNPGPLGQHPFPKVPTRDGKPAPVVITAGSNDGVVHCVGADPDAIPTANECAPVALHDAMLAEYCPDESATGYLDLLIWRPEAGVTVADHSDVTGLVAAASPSDLRFAGSPLERFMSAAYAGTLAPGCTQRIGNPA